MSDIRPKGIDLSHNNASFDWNKLRPDIKFVILKATQGGGFRDGTFNANWQTLKQRNIIRGAYHFLTFTSTAQEQADNFLSRGIDFSKPGCLPPILDIEDQVPSSLNVPILQNREAFIKLAQDWLSIVKEKTGRTPIIYSYKDFFHTYLKDIDFGDYDLWLAAYQDHEPGLPLHFSKYTFWQYSQYGSATRDGNDGVDCDLFNGTIDELRALANDA